MGDGNLGDGKLHNDNLSDGILGNGTPVNGTLANGACNNFLPSFHEPVSECWKAVEGDFVCWLFVSTSRIGKDAICAPIVVFICLPSSSCTKLQKTYKFNCVIVSYRIIVAIVSGDTHLQLQPVMNFWQQFHTGYISSWITTMVVGTWCNPYDNISFLVYIVIIRHTYMI